MLCSRAWRLGKQRQLSLLYGQEKKETHFKRKVEFAFSALAETAGLSHLETELDSVLLKRSRVFQVIYAATGAVCLKP